jgi:gliding motility-associated-like protein
LVGARVTNKYMISMSRKGLLRSFSTLLVAFFGLSGAHAQPVAVPTLGKEFWFGFMENLLDNTSALKVFVSSLTDTQGTLSIPLVGISENFTVQAGQITELEVPLFAMNIGSGSVSEWGLVLRTQDTVAVFALNFTPATSDASLILPVGSLGSDYLVHAMRSVPNGAPSQFLVVATVNDTEVEITTTANTSSGQLAGVPFTVQLDSGETYQVQGAPGSQSLDMSGSRVRATEASGPCRPFAVFGGAVCVNIPTQCYACDHVMEQNLPSNVWGNSYYAVPFANGTRYYLQLMAREDGTVITSNGGSSVSLDAGEVLDIANVEGALHLSGNKPFSVAQYMQGLECSGLGDGDPCMLVLGAESQRIRDVVFSTIQSDIVENHWVNIVVPSDFVNAVFLDGVLLPSSAFEGFPDGTLYSYAALPIAEGTHRLQCEAALSAYVYGSGGFETYAYSVGSYNPLPLPEVTDVICVDSIGQQVTLAAPIPLFQPTWTLQSQPDVILGTELSYTFTVQENGVYVLSGNGNLSGCSQQFLFAVELAQPPSFFTSVNGVASDTALSLCANVPILLEATVDLPGEWVYSWSPAIFVSQPDSASTEAFPVQDTTFRVVVSSPNGCSSATDSIFISVLPSAILDVQVEADTSATCSDTQVQLAGQILVTLQRDELDGTPGPIWQSIEGGTINDVCGALSGNALYFNGSGQRAATTVPFDMSLGGRLRFGLRIANGTAPCDNAEGGEGVLLEYSTNGGSDWATLSTYDQAAFPNVATVEAEVPGAAQTEATLFRWRQTLNATADEDNWVLDRVTIGAYDTQNIQFYWSPGSLVNDSTLLDPVATVLDSVSYSLTVNDGFCTAAAVLDILVYPTPSFVLPNDTSLCTPDTFFVEVPSGLGDYLWQDGSTGNTYFTTVSRTVALEVTDGPCSSTESVVVEVLDCVVDLIMPNVFSPNGDVENAVFEPIKFTGAKDIDMLIFDRWGTRVWRSTSPNFAWQGKAEDGTSVAEGTYFWTLSYTGIVSGEKGSAKGNVTLLR